MSRQRNGGSLALDAAQVATCPAQNFSHLVRETPNDT